MDIKVTLAGASQRKQRPDDGQLGFGRYFSDHMFLCAYEVDRGWHDARIVPHQALSLDPACAVLHYAQQVFEGLKAYRGVDGGIRLFRYRDNLERMLRSAKRLCMPEFDLDAMAAGLKQLVLIDREWIPQTEGCSLYIRPNLIAVDPYLGIRPAQSYLFYLILGPVGAYYPQGFSSISIMVEEKYVRACQGGVGEAKTGGNYAASLLGQVEAQAKGFTQVLWLDAKERKYVEEVGTMNIFFVIDGEVVTSPLGGTVLPGITRDSVLKLLRHWGDHKVSERRLSIDEVTEAAENGRVAEVFGTGTAAIISPVGSLSYGGRSYEIAEGRTGPLSQRLYDAIVGMQYGHGEDPFGWVERIDL